MLYKIEASKKKIWGKNNFFKKPSKELFNKIDFQWEEGDESKIANWNDATLTFIGESAQTPYTYIKITTNDATYYYYKQNMSGVLSMREQENDDGTTSDIYEYQHNFIIDTWNTYESDMFKILEQENPKVYFLRKLCNRYMDTGTGDKGGLYCNIKKQFGYSNPLPIKADLNSCESETITNTTLLTQNGYDRTTGQDIVLASVTNQYNPSLNVVSKIYIEYQIYDGSGHKVTENITSFDNRSTRSIDQLTLKLTYKYGYSKKGISQIQVNYMEIYINPKFSISNAETLQADIKQKTPDDTDTTYNKDMMWDSSNYKFYTQRWTLKSFTVADQSTTGYIDFKAPFSYTDNSAPASNYTMNTTMFDGSESNDKNKNYYIVANQNAFNKNEAFADTSESGNIKNKNISYFIIPSMGDYTIKAQDGTIYKVTKDEWFQATLNSNPYQKDSDGTTQYSPIVIASDGIVTNVSCTLPPELICQGRGFVAEQGIYSSDEGKAKMIPIPFVAFDYYNDNSISYALVNIDKTDSDPTTGDESNEPYLMYSPQFVQYKLVNTSNDNLIIPVGNYDMYYRENGINAYLSITDKIKLILDTNNFNNISEKSNIGDNFLINMSNPVIFETQAFNNGYVNNPTSETMGRQNFKEEQESFNIETNMLKRDNNLSLANNIVDTTVDAVKGASAANADLEKLNGTPGAKMFDTLKKTSQAIAKMVVGQQDFKDKMKKREIGNNISMRNFENKYNSIRLGKATINIGAYHTNALRNMTDGLLLYKIEPLDEVKQAIMQEIYDYGYTYNAMDYFNSYKNRTLYNVIQLDTSFNLQDIYLSVENNYDSIFNTQSNIEGFIAGLGAIKQILEQEPQDILPYGNIEIVRPDILSLELTPDEYLLTDGTTLTINYKIYDNGVDITQDCTYNGVTITNLPDDILSNVKITTPGEIQAQVVGDYSSGQGTAKVQMDIFYHGKEYDPRKDVQLYYGTIYVTGPNPQEQTLELDTNTYTYTQTNTLPNIYTPYNGIYDGKTFTNGGAWEVGAGTIPDNINVTITPNDDNTCTLTISGVGTSQLNFNINMYYLLNEGNNYRYGGTWTMFQTPPEVELYGTPVGAEIKSIKFSDDFKSDAEGTLKGGKNPVYGWWNGLYSDSTGNLGAYIALFDRQDEVKLYDTDTNTGTDDFAIYDGANPDILLCSGNKETKTLTFPMTITSTDLNQNSYTGTAICYLES